MVSKNLSKFFKRLAIAAVALGTVGGITTAVVACGSSTISSAQSQTVSALQKGAFKNNDKQIDLVGIGDSVTAGYTTVEYGDRTEDGDNPNGSYSAYLNKLLQGAKKNNAKGRVSSYNNLAVNGAKTPDLLDVINGQVKVKGSKTTVDKELNAKNQKIIAEGDLFVGTIGANDILQSVLIAGIPWSTISSLVGGGSASLPTTGNVLQDALMYQNILSSITDVSKGKMSALFRPDFLNEGPKKFKSIFDNLLTNFGKIINGIHAKAPEAMIVFNKYVYPFNRYLQNGKDVTDMVYSDDPGKYASQYGLPSEVKTFHDAFDYIMASMKNVAGKYGFVIWNDMQADQDELIVELIAANKVKDKAEALRLMQADKADIHPTEFAHALIARKIYDELLAPLLGENISLATYDDVKSKVAGGSLGRTQLINILADFLLKSSGDKTPDNVFVGNLVELIGIRLLNAGLSSALSSPGEPITIESVLSKTAYYKLYRYINKFLTSGRVDADTDDLVQAIQEAMYDVFYGPASDEVLKSFIAPNVFAPTDFLDNADPAILATAMVVLPQVAIAPSKFGVGIYPLLSNKVFASSLSDADKTAVKNGFGFTDADMANPAAFETALAKYYEAPANQPSWTDKDWRGPVKPEVLPDKTVVDVITKQGKLLREWVGIANAIATIFPQAFYSNYAPGKALKPLTLADLKLDSEMMFTLVDLQA